MQSSSSNSAALTSNSISGSGTYTYEKYTASTTTADLISAPFTGEWITNNTNIYTNPSDNTQFFLDHLLIALVHIKIMILIQMGQKQCHQQKDFEPGLMVLLQICLLANTLRKINILKYIMELDQT